MVDTLGIDEFDEVDWRAVNTIRTLSMDAVQRANSGHPGAPMGLAPVVYLLYSRFLKHCPTDPQWPDRDRFVLSCGHASMLLYSILHLAGYDLSMDDIKAFRQWQSRTPGHPEHGLVPGVEVTTGPLGQGCSTAVGMAMAEAHLAAEFNRGDKAVVDHMTWALVSDGDLMEGVASEAASLAGHLRLGKMVWIYDDNRITIEGGTDLAFSEDVAGRFAAYGWDVEQVVDVNNLRQLSAALDRARSSLDRPTLIIVRSHIAYGAPTKQDSASSHGAPLGEEEVAGAKRSYGWPEDQSFLVPGDVADRCRVAVSRGEELVRRWQAARQAWAEGHPELASELGRRLDRALPVDWTENLPTFTSDAKPLATRAASGQVLNAIADALPELVGGSADLAPSCKTTINTSSSVAADNLEGRNIHFGIREHAMGAVLNGIALHGGLRPFGSTFLVFSDYMRPAIRLAALMEQPVIYVFTHDSVWVGEDGPTHQPVEHVAALRSIPGLVVLRPADGNETAAAWRRAVERRDGPTALILSRQGLPTLGVSPTLAMDGTARGAYVVAEAIGGPPRIILVASGSEVQLALSASIELSERGVPARVVSMPSWELFDRQDEDYRRRLLPRTVPRLAVEAGISRGWRDYVGEDGAVIGIDRFGASAPGREVAEQLGINLAAVVARAVELVKAADAHEGDDQGGKV